MIALAGVLMFVYVAYVIIGLIDYMHVVESAHDTVIRVPAIAAALIILFWPIHFLVQKIAKN